MNDARQVKPIRRVRWPIAMKLSIVLLLASLAPLIVASIINVRRGLDTVEETALQNLELLARVTTTRLDQLIIDTKRVQQLTSLDETIVRFCAAPASDRQSLAAEVQHELQTVVDTNPDFATCFVVGTDGIGLASTNPQNVGMDLNFREYLRRALAGEQYISEVLVGKTTRRPGIYFSGPIKGDAGAIIGALVIKLQGERLQEICQSVAVPGRHSFAAIVDEHTTILAHPDETMRYRSVLPIDDRTQAAIDPMTRYGIKRIEPLQDESMREIIDMQSPQGNARFYSKIRGETLIVGYARMTQRNWRVSIVQPRSDFDKPLVELRRASLLSAIAVGIFAMIIALMQARNLVRPLHELRDVSEQIANGDLTARANVTTHDEIGQLAGVFNQMIPQLEERAKMRDALRLAQEIQRNLLPERAPDLPNADIAGLNIPADETGGDYYDFLDLTAWRDDTIAIAVGDVTGHGIPAALLMATARALLRSRATPPGDLADLIQSVNVRLCEDTTDERFMTLMYALFNRNASELRLVSAGHDPIILFDPDNDTFTELEGDDVPLGIVPDWTFHEKRFENLPDHAILAIATDGVWEAMNRRREQFGKERLHELIRANQAHTARQIIDNVLGEIKTFQAGEKQQDDITLVIVKFT